MSVLVLITGAGASHRLGIEDSNPPLMGGWAADLCDRLGPNTDLLGLTRNMLPEDFETALGKFLRFTRSLPDVAAYPRAGIGDWSARDDEIVQWFRQAKSTAQQVMEHLYTSLHSLFARSTVSAFNARSAYEPLLASLQVERLTYATTNYDVAGEMALDELGKRPYAGLDAPASPGQSQVLHYDDIISVEPRQTPVLHLHGRVGWYFTPNEQVVAADSDTPYNPDLGTPALLLPEPKKAYEDAVSLAIWNQFRASLRQATHVLVLGHSLNDESLRSALLEVPDQKLAVTIWAQAGTPVDLWKPDADELLERIGRRPHVIPMDFGPKPCAEIQRLSHFVSGAAPEHNSFGEIASL